MDTNFVTNTVFVLGTQYYYDPNSVWVCANFFLQGIEVGMLLYGIGRIYRYLRQGTGEW